MPAKTNIHDLLSLRLGGGRYDVHPGVVLVLRRGDVGFVRRLLDEAGHGDMAVRHGREHPSGVGLQDPRASRCARRIAARFVEFFSPRGTRRAT